MSASENAFHFGAELRRIRKELEWSQVDLAGASSMSQGYVSILENGEADPTRDVLEDICRAFNRRDASLARLHQRPATEPGTGLLTRYCDAMHQRVRDARTSASGVLPTNAGSPQLFCGKAIKSGTLLQP